MYQVVIRVGEMIKSSADLPDMRFIAFFDEVNTSRCLGVFKELFIDRTIAGVRVPDNLFFVGAINPLTHVDGQLDATVNAPTCHYDVYPLPPALDDLRFKLPSLDGDDLNVYVGEKIGLFREQLEKEWSGERLGPEAIQALEFFQHDFCKLIVSAHEYIRTCARLPVSQREIQRVFQLTDFFLLRDHEAHTQDPRETFKRAIYMATALVRCSLRTEYSG